MNTSNNDRLTRCSRSTQKSEEQPSGKDTAPIAVDNQPIYFFQGDFRTWAQVEARARLQMALASQIDRYSPR